MIKKNLYQVSSVLSRLDKAYNNAENKQFKKIWLSKWNDYAEKNTHDNFKPRDFDYEQKFNVDKSNMMCNN